MKVGCLSEAERAVTPTTKRATASSAQVALLSNKNTRIVPHFNGLTEHPNKSAPITYVFRLGSALASQLQLMKHIDVCGNIKWIHVDDVGSDYSTPPTCCLPTTCWLLPCRSLLCSYPRNKGCSERLSTIAIKTAIAG